MDADEATGELVSVEQSVNAAMEQITRAEIDQQIATAHRFPRSLAKFKTRALEMATLDEETAESCIYSRPVGKGPDGKQKFAEGLSIRMAEIVGCCFGNLRVGAMIVEMTPRHVKARGFAHDLETNFASTSEVIEATVDRRGNPYSERQRVVVAKAALSKARRDATFAVVPKALCRSIEIAARQTAIGDASTLEKRRAAVMGWIAKLGIDPARVFAALGVGGEADIGIEHLTTLTGLRTAIKDGEATVDESFPPVVEVTAAGTAASAASRLKEAAARKGKKQAATEQAPPPVAPEPDAFEARTHAGPTAAEVEQHLRRASNQDLRDQAADMIRDLPDAGDRERLTALYTELSAQT